MSGCEVPPPLEGQRRTTGSVLVYSILHCLAEGAEVRERWRMTSSSGVKSRLPPLPRVDASCLSMVIMLRGSTERGVDNRVGVAAVASPFWLPSASFKRCG